jgi:hypothetical protein
LNPKLAEQLYAVIYSDKLVKVASFERGVFQGTQERERYLSAIRLVNDGEASGLGKAFS